MTDRLCGEGAMRFLFYRYNNICEPDMIEALTELGHSIDTIELEMENKDPEPRAVLETIHAAFGSKAYDALFSVNFYPLLSRICEAFKVRYISWTTDCPVDELFSTELKNPVNRTFCFDYAQYERAHAINPDRVFYMPLATNVARWDRVIAQAPPEELQRFGADVSFVGSLYTEKKGQDWFESSAALRLEAVNTTAGVLSEMGQDPLCLYTGSNTENLPVKNCGRVRTHTEMPLVFNQSSINLNVTCTSIRTGIPQRIWDVCGAGGFVLTNHQAEIDEFFVIGEDLEVFESQEELREKIKYYLTHEEERRRIAMNGYNKVKAEHTYVSRMADILYIAFAV